jgi:hypothetical protein
MGTYIDFLCGWTLHDIVCPSSTLTQRTIYDCGALAGFCGGGAREGYLAVYLELLHARHSWSVEDSWSWWRLVGDSIINSCWCLDGLLVVGG